MTTIVKTLGDLLPAAREHGSLPGSIEHATSEWFIGPVGHHRESDLISESNWDVTLTRFAEVDPEGNDHEVVNFGHFAVGWVEEIAYRPGSAVAAVASEISESLGNYPILSEDDYSEKQAEAEGENWHDICRDLAKDVGMEVARTVEISADDLSETLDDTTDNEWFDLAHEYGENDGEGWIRYSGSDVAAIATAWVALKLVDA